MEIFTNATLINEKWIEIFKKHKLNVRFSLYSYDEQNHDHVTTVKGSFQQTMSAIKLLQESGIPYFIASIAMKGINLGSKLENVCIAQQDIVRMAGRASNNLLDRKLAKQKLITQDSFTDPLNTDRLIRRVTHNLCFSTKIFIDTRLDVYPCAMERRFKHGNIRHNSLKSILKDEIINLNKDHIQECRECEYRYACSDCRPDSFSDDVHCKPWYCTYNPRQGKWENTDQFLDVLGF